MRIPFIWRYVGLIACASVPLIAACASSASGGEPPSPEMSADASSAARYDSVTLTDLRQGTRNGAWRSTYEPLPSRPTVIRGATVLTAAGRVLQNSDIAFADGKIIGIGQGIDIPANVVTVEGAGRYVTPGLIDTHSHLGVSATPEVAAHCDNNDAGSTTHLWIDHSIWPQGPGFTRALAAGVTTAQLLPGSGDLIEGRGVTVKLVPGRTPQDMIFPESSWGLKMACGENPKRGGGFPNTIHAVAIVGGTVHTVSGPVIENGVVVMEGGILTAVGATTEVAIPAGAVRVDASGRVVTPGLFDAATAMGLIEVGAVSDTRDASFSVDDPIRAAFRVTDAINANSVAIPITRLGGVTTVLSAPSGGVLAGIGAVIDLHGLTMDAMLVSDRPAMFGACNASAASGTGDSRGGVALRLREVFEDAQVYGRNQAAYERGGNPCVRRVATRSRSAAASADG